MMSAIAIYMVSGPPEDEVQLGLHRFARTPISGEMVSAYVDGELGSYEVESVHHATRPANGVGPSGDPAVFLRVTPI